MELSKFLWVVGAIGLFAALFVFTPYEAYLEGILALGIVAAAAMGFLMHPRREVFYVRTTVRLVDPDRNQTLEQDFLAVRAELARLWLLFVPTFLAAAILVFFAAGGSHKVQLLELDSFITIFIHCAWGARVLPVPAASSSYFAVGLD